MERVYSAEINGCMIIVAAQDDVYTGIIRQQGNVCYRQSHESLDVLKANLHNEAGKLHPDYIGIDGAITRFKQFFPLGFNDPFYKYKERDYKDEVVRRVSGLSVFALQNELASKERVLNYLRSSDLIVEDKAKQDTVVKEVEKEVAELKSRILTVAPPDQWRLSASDVTINLLSSFENARLYDVFSYRQREAFFEGVNTLILESMKPAPNYELSLKSIEAAITPYGRASWPLVTIMPFLWGPSDFSSEAPNTMFLKPVATKDYAERVGHEFAHKYRADINSETYLSLLDLAEWTHGEITDLKPRDRIDIQSFIWVVGNYKDDDLKEAEDFRASRRLLYRNV